MLALDLNATTVAEGVESADDLATLKEIGVDAAQGYLLGRPSSDREALVRWLGVRGEAVQATHE
jgi:EAL domain-containing protein (putative c-di-GMP-specific phosphodiesterase class I)